MIIGPLDEYPIHQAPLPAARPVSSDRNFYDRCYFNVIDTEGDGYAIGGLGFYPNLGVKDAFLLTRQGQRQSALHLSDELDAERLYQRVGPMRVEVLEPLHRLRVVLEETHGFAADLIWEGSFGVVQEQRHLLLSGVRPTLDAQRFAQLGTWTGSLLLDGHELAVTPDRWIGSRDRSWGIRPSGEPEPAGRPAEPPMEGFWWLYVPLCFEEYAVVVILQEEPDGFRSLNDASRIWRDGRVEQLGWPRVEIEYAPDSRHPVAAVLHCTDPTGAPVRIEVAPRLGMALHVGGGYGGDPDWAHGQWKGAGFAERVDYDLADEAVAGRLPFGVTDHAASATCRDRHGEAVGHGLFEHASMGRHDPTGFVDWGTSRTSTLHLHGSAGGA